MHYVKGSEDANGNILLGAVIGVFFDREAGGNRDNPFIESYLDARETHGSGDEKNISLRSFLAGIDFTDYWSYDGSLTTPPCSEGIKWSVIKNVQPISDRQLKIFTENLADDDNWSAGKGNNRQLMPLNGRTLSYSGASQLLAGAAAALTALVAFSF